MILLLLLPLAMASCGGGDDEPTVTSKDPEGTAIINLRCGDFWDVPYIGSFNGHMEGAIYLDEACNFCSSDNWDSFICVGKVNGLSSVKKVPVTGWSKSVAATPGMGYIAKYDGTYIADDQYEEGDRLIRMYVVEYILDSSNNVIGAVVKYQYPFNP